MQLVWNYLKQYKRLLFFALLLAIINQGFSLLDPQIFRLIIDNYVSRVGELSQESFLSGIIILLLASIGVAFVSRVAKNFQDYYVNVITQRVGTRLYATSVDHSFSLPYSAFEDQRSGELLQKLQKARVDSQTLIFSFINVVFLSCVGIVFVLTYAFFVHWVIGTLYTLIIPVLGGATFFLTRRIKQAQKSIIVESASLAGATTETLRNVELVKSLGLETQEIARLNAVNEKILGLELKKIKLIRVLSFIQGTFINAIRSTLLLVMLWFIFRQFITVGEFFSLYIYSFFVFNPLSEFGNVSSQFQEAKASTERLQEILKTPKEEIPASPQRIQGLTSIQFKDVYFSYNDINTPSVKDVSMEIKQGETVAFVGPSGSGKSTMVKLLVGLYRSTQGNLLFNGIPVHELDIQDFRKRIGFVSQETQLFQGTIRENLLFVRPEATDEECIDALRSASALEIIERGGKGLDTRIGEGGIKISGGERQRLAIARALLRKPELIIFDEATSSLDSITEKEITRTIQNIEKTQPNLITILVAHRLSTIIHAKRIYVFEKGAIIEEGNHDELEKKNGLYAALSREQRGEA